MYCPLKLSLIVTTNVEKTGIKICMISSTYKHRCSLYSGNCSNMHKVQSHHHLIYPVSLEKHQVAEGYGSVSRQQYVHIKRIPCEITLSVAAYVAGEQNIFSSSGLIELLKESRHFV